MADREIDTLALATDELTEHAIPDAEMLLSELSTIAQVYYLNQVAYFVFGAVANGVIADVQMSSEDEAEIADIVQRLGVACSALDGVCQVFGILPKEGDES